jgi:hypothetical protein
VAPKPHFPGSCPSPSAIPIRSQSRTLDTVSNHNFSQEAAPREVVLLAGAPGVGARTGKETHVSFRAALQSSRSTKTMVRDERGRRAALGWGGSWLARRERVESPTGPSVSVPRRDRQTRRASSTC